MKKLVVLTGAGISAESGIATFRDQNGLWEGHDVMEVASPEGWRKNKALVLDFYNQRRKNAMSVKPNAGHYTLAKLEEHFDVQIITQNVDNLHEQAGSTKVLHLHGELFKSQSTLYPKLIYDVKNGEINIGDKCEFGSQLRPYIVWFGEAVPKFEEAIQIPEEADFFAIIGTSLLVYPAASLRDYVPNQTPTFLIDKNPPAMSNKSNLIIYDEVASTGVEKMRQELLKMS